MNDEKKSNNGHDGNSISGTLHTCNKEHPFLEHQPHAIRMSTAIDADNPNRSANYDCTDCMHYGVCYAIARGRDPKDPCKDLELEPWCVDKDDKNQ